MMAKLRDKPKWWQISAGAVSLITLMGFWFTFAGAPPYASAEAVELAQGTAISALQQSWENKVDAQQRRVNDQRHLIDLKGSTPERLATLRSLLHQLSRDRAERDRKYK
jgi:hypothetical protein